MLSFSHTLISLPLAYYFDNPLIIFVVAALGHFICDALLHWNFYPEQWKGSFYPLVALEILAGLGTTWWLLGADTLTLPVLAAIAGGNAPDIVHQSLGLLPSAIRQRWFSWANPWLRWHDSLQFETPFALRGLISQATLISLSLLALTFRT